MITIEEYISSCKQKLEPYIDEYLAGLIAKMADGRLADLYETFREAGKGGKCIRGSLVKLGYELALGSQAGEEILPICASVEILQTAILGHDDIIDKSPLRRGRDSMWRALERLVETRAAEKRDIQGRKAQNHEADDENSNERHYGISQTICLGDVGISLANSLIIESSFEPDKKIKAMKKFIEVQLNTVDGEMLDVLMSYGKDYGDEEGIFKIARLKTAWYTIAGPLQLGAVLGGASPELLDAMRRYGVFLGTAFQLRDDILGIDADEAEIGKSNTSDIAEGKVTLLAHFAMKRATPEQLEQLRGVYGSGAVSETDRLAVHEIFENTGAFTEVAKKAESYLAEAAGVVGEITQNAEQAALLIQLGEMMARRKS
jgi:geranylgeranyl diphosphate synthase type I